MTSLQRQQLETAQERERQAWLAFAAAPRNPDLDRAWQEASRALIDGITGKHPCVQFVWEPNEGLLDA